MNKEELHEELVKYLSGRGIENIDDMALIELAKETLNFLAVANGSMSEHVNTASEDIMGSIDTSRNDIIEKIGTIAMDVSELVNSLPRIYVQSSAPTDARNGDIWAW